MLLVIVIIIVGFFFATRVSKIPTINQTIIQQEIVRVGYREHGAYWPLFLGMEKGFFTKENIKIEKVPFTSTNQLMSALIAGQIDAALGGVNTTILATLENKSPGEFKIFTIFNEDEDKYFSAILVRANSNITDLAQLSNKKVSTQPGSTTKFLFKKSINDKIAPTSAILEQMDSSLQLSSLESGQTDAAIVFEPTATIGVETGISKIITTSLFHKDIMPNCPVGGSVISTKFLQNNPELAKKFIRATNEVIIYGETHEQEVNSAIAMYTPFTIDLAKKVPVLQNKTTSQIDKSQLQSFFDLLLQEKEIENPIDVNQLLLPLSYVENK